MLSNYNHAIARISGEFTRFEREIIDHVMQSPNECELLAYGSCYHCNTYLAFRYGHLVIVNAAEPEIDYKAEQVLCIQLASQFLRHNYVDPNRIRKLRELQRNRVPPQVTLPRSQPQAPIIQRIREPCSRQHLDDHICEPCTRQHDPVCTRPHNEPCDLPHNEPCELQHMQDHQCPTVCNRDHLDAHTCPSSSSRAVCWHFECLGQCTMAPHPSHPTENVILHAPGSFDPPPFGANVINVPFYEPESPLWNQQPPQPVSHLPLALQNDNSDSETELTHPNECPHCHRIDGTHPSFCPHNPDSVQLPDHESDIQGFTDQSEQESVASEALTHTTVETTTSGRRRVRHRRRTRTNRGTYVFDGRELPQGMSYPVSRNFTDRERANFDESLSTIASQEDEPTETAHTLSNQTTTENTAPPARTTLFGELSTTGTSQSNTPLIRPSFRQSQHNGIQFRTASLTGFSEPTLTPTSEAQPSSSATRSQASRSTPDNDIFASFRS
jgi:hypothetical protein